MGLSRWAFLGALVLFIKRGRPGFGRFKVPKAGPRPRRRESLHIKVPDHAILSPRSSRLLSRIMAAGKQENWTKVELYLSNYSGTAVPIYTGGMTAAFRCEKYEEGALLYDKCRRCCQSTDFDEPFYSTAVRLFGKLKSHARVCEVYDGALERLEGLNEVLASCRINAAADLNDVRAAAQVLDQLEENQLEIEIYHLASAIRACWGAEGHRDLVAQYFYDQVHPLGLKPNLVTFSNLAGAQWEAPVESILATYRQMQEFQLKPNEVFAEIYLLSVLQKPYGTLWERSIPFMRKVLQNRSLERLEVVREALEDFEEANAHTALSRCIAAALKQQR